MRAIKVALLLGVLTAVVAAEENAEIEYDEGGSAPSPSPSARTRPSLLPQRQNKPLPGSSNRLNKLPTGDKHSVQKSTTTVGPPVQEVEENQEDYYDQGPEDAPADVTSTEAPKKLAPARPSSRPVRPNDELLAVLKRKRQHALNTGTVAERTTTTSTTTSSPSSNHHNKKSGNNGRRGRTQKGSQSSAQSQTPSTEETSEAETPRKPQSRKFYSRNSGRTTAAPTSEEPIEEQHPVEEQPRHKFHRGPSRRS